MPHQDLGSKSSKSQYGQKLQEFLRNLFLDDSREMERSISRIIYLKQPKIDKFIDYEIFQILTESTKSFQVSQESNSKDSAEERICEWIFDFFSHYYTKGQLISHHGFSRGQHSTSYLNNEGVILSWANQDQYYVKTVEKSKKSTDHFIHRHLRDFLIQELEYYITNEAINLKKLLELTEDKDFAANDQYLQSVRIFRHIAISIIEILSDIENFKKKLWEKPKLIVNSDYCITLDYIDAEIYPEILKNEKQIAEWDKNHFLTLVPSIKKNTIDSQTGNFLELGTTKQLKYLNEHPSLMIDTKFFSTDFKYRILGRIPNLDDNIVGILFNSDNFHVLNLLQAKFRHRINCCYIDPPFNARSSRILYKNTFKHSSWLTLMANRLELTHPILAPPDGVLIVAIDENEQERLGLLLEASFPKYVRTCVSVVHNPGGIQGKNFAYSHEYAYFIYPP
ncbi:MAG: DNA methyltransferase, partial [Promethearchaeota archaeon]